MFFNDAILLPATFIPEEMVKCKIINLKSTETIAHMVFDEILRFLDSAVACAWSVFSNYKNIYFVKIYVERVKDIVSLNQRSDGKKITRGTGPRVGNHTHWAASMDENYVRD